MILTGSDVCSRSTAKSVPIFISLACISLPRFSHSCPPQSGFLDHRLHRTRSSVTKQASRRQATKLLGMTDGQCANAGHWQARRLNSLPSSLARLIRNFLRFELACAHLDAAANTRTCYTILTANVTGAADCLVSQHGIASYVLACAMLGCQGGLLGYA